MSVIATRITPNVPPSNIAPNRLHTSAMTTHLVLDLTDRRSNA
jgi:hypothetical protein